MNRSAFPKFCSAASYLPDELLTLFLVAEKDSGSVMGMSREHRR
jgi:hypothetical protein